MAENRTRRRWALALALLLAFGGTAWAERAEADDENGDDEETTLEEYVRVDVSAIPQSNTIGTKLPTSLQITPAIVGTVSSELFREQQAVTLSDVLENVSGLNIQSQNGIQDFFILRGFDSLSGSLVMMDGAPVPEATFYPTYNIEGVEVLKGPGGFLYGGDPLAGRDFNPDAFIDCSRFDTFDDVVEHVARVDADDDLYRSYLTAPFFAGGVEPEFLRTENIVERFRSIFESTSFPLSTRRRRLDRAVYAKRMDPRTSSFQLISSTFQSLLSSYQSCRLAI